MTLLELWTPPIRQPAPLATDGQAHVRLLAAPAVMAAPCSRPSSPQHWRGQSAWTLQHQRTAVPAAHTMLVRRPPESPTQPPLQRRLRIASRTQHCSDSQVSLPAFAAAALRLQRICLPADSGNTRGRDAPCSRSPTCNDGRVRRCACELPSPSPSPPSSVEAVSGVRPPMCHGSAAALGLVRLISRAAVA